MSPDASPKLEIGAAAPPKGRPRAGTVRRAREFLRGRFPAARYPLMVFCDFDGTIATDDLCHAALARFADPQWSSVEERWLRGEITSQQSLPAQFATFRATRRELEAFCASVKIAEGFAGFARFLIRRGMPLAVLSDGVDLYIEPTMRRLGLAQVLCAANRGVLTSQGVRVEFPHADPGCSQCAACKCAFLDAADAMAGETWYVGDGLSDWCASHRADRTYALGGLLRLRRRFGPPVREFAGFPALREEAETFLEDGS